MFNIPIYYFDNNATTKMDPKVLDEMLPYFKECYGNSSCSHDLGAISKIAIEKARLRISAILGDVNKNNIYFTSGATESNNIIIKGLLLPKLINNEKVKVLTSKIEHPSVLNTLKELKKYYDNLEIVYLKVNRDGIVDVKLFEEIVSQSEFDFATIMAANNETGAVQPIDILSRICQKYSIFFHTDATQLFGKYPDNIIADNINNIDAVSISSHKIYGPKGVGALYFRSPFNTIDFFNIISGGMQERGIRSGTENVPGIVGFGMAAMLLKDIDYHEIKTRKKQIEDFINDPVNKKFNIVCNTCENSLVNTINISLPKYTNDINPLFIFMKYFYENNICLGTKSACSSQENQESYVLKAMGRTNKEASSSIRISLSKYTTEKEVQYFIKVFQEFLKFLDDAKNNKIMQ